MRSRTFDWEEPTAIWHRAEGKSGLELLRMAIDGDIPQPPMARLMDIRLIEVCLLYTSDAADDTPCHYNPLGSVHGGFGATLLDSAMGCAVHSTLMAGDTYTTLEFKINFTRPLQHNTGAVRGIGRVIHAGRTTSLAEGRIEDASGKLYAFATTTCLIKRAGRD